MPDAAVLDPNVVRARKRRLRGLASFVSAHLGMTIVSLLFAGPIVIIIVASLKSSTILDYSFGPGTWSLHNYEAVLNNPLMPRYILNSFIVAGSLTVLTVIIDLLAAFAFAKLSFPGRRVGFALMLATLMLPFSVTLVPAYLITASLGLVDSYAGIVIPSLAGPFGVFLLRQFLLGIPDSFIEAARIDGASYLRIFRSIIVPLCAQPMAVLAIFTFVAGWNAFLWPLLITQSEELRTLTLGIAVTNTQTTVNYGGITAAVILSLIPMAILYFAFQRYFVNGILAGALK